MDVLCRRECLSGRPNPAPRRDYVVLLQVRATMVQSALTQPLVRLAYIPDRLLLDPAAFERYVRGLGRWMWPGPEDLAVAVIDDVGNEIVPRWVRVSLDSGALGSLIVEERQPLWRGTVPDGAW
ncbi:hypothetical protein [Pararhodospirillum photometricum]|nr:hypothetical protein [Pararhodospirillum photometricum]